MMLGIVDICLALTLGLAVAALLAYLRWEYSSFVRTIDLIPGPPKLPIVGHAMSVPRDSEELLKTIQGDWIEKYGRIYRVWFGRQTFVDISSPELMEKVLASQKYINKGDSYDVFLRPWLGDGLLLASGNKWRKHRRLLTPAFHFQILDSFIDVFNKNSDILCQQLSKSADSEVDVFPYLKRCTLDIICESAMGIQINAQMQDSPYIQAVQRLSEVIITFFLSPFQVLPSWAYYNLTRLGREHRKLLQYVHSFTSKVIRDRKLELEQQNAFAQYEDQESASMGLKKRRAFLDLMLVAQKDGANLTDANIREEVDTFMFEGHDTTASALVWFLYCMATHPSEQDLVRKELHHVFGDSTRPCTMEDLTHLKHLDCCIKEALRLYPSVPNIKRYIDQDFELGGYAIPAGASISLHIFALHRNEEFFPDALSFKPERFRADQSAGRHTYTYVPFSAGSRNCIGQRFALIEEKVVIATLLRQFRFSYDVAKHGPPPICADLVLKPKHGMPLTITRCDP